MRQHLKRIALSAALSVVCVTTAGARSTSTIPGDARFEVATIKPGVPGANHGIQFLTSFTRVYTQNTSVTDLLKYAYGLHAAQIIGGPDNLMHEGFSIEATVGAQTALTPNAELLKQMLRNLLADRFGLATHNDIRQLPVYLLTTEAPHLKPTEQTMPMTTGGYGNGNLAVHNGSPRELAAYLQRFVTDRPVLDRTGIHGCFDMDLHFTPEDMPTKPDSATELPGLFTAIRQQLGLKLTAAKADTPVLVIDQVTPPSAN